MQRKINTCSKDDPAKRNIQPSALEHFVRMLAHARWRGRPMEVIIRVFKGVADSF